MKVNVKLTLLHVILVCFDSNFFQFFLFLRQSPNELITLIESKMIKSPNELLAVIKSQ